MLSLLFVLAPISSPFSAAEVGIFFQFGEESAVLIKKLCGVAAAAYGDYQLSCRFRDSNSIV